MNQNTHRPPALEWLTVLRYWATVWVIMKHCLHNFGDDNAIPDSLRKSFMERGFLGVPFFFILSGFILTYNYPVIRSKVDYLAARAGRILPVYYLSLLFCVPMLLHEVAVLGVAHALPRTLMFLTLTQAWVPNFTSFWNFPAWTLCCEVFFYILLLFILEPLKAFIGQSSKRAYGIIAGCFVFGLIGPTLFQLNFGDPTMQELDDPANATMITASNFIKIFPLWHLTEFLSGVVLCIGLRSRLPDLVKYSGTLIGLGTAQVLTSVLIPKIFSQGSYCLPGFVLIVLGAAAFPYPDLKTATPVKKWLATKLLLLGNASYSVYLFHVPIIYYLCFTSRHVVHFLPEGEAGVWSLYVLDVLITTALGMVVYNFYEQPARKWVAAQIRQRYSYLESPPPLAVVEQEPA